MRSLEEIINKSMLNYIDKKKLCLIPGKRCWVLDFSAYIMGAVEYIYVDKLSIALYKCLLKLEIPFVDVTYNELLDEYEISIDEKNASKSLRINIQDVPIVMTFGEVSLRLYVSS
jgi:exosome complex RNA-binding protein Rrp42 (RNase PH superfamily)